MTPTSANGSGTTPKDIQASTTKPTAPPQTSPTMSPEDLYDYQKCTVMIVIQLRPQEEAGKPRPVLLSVQNGAANKEDLPLYRLLPSEEDLGGPLPPTLVALLQALQQDLPIRKQRNAERKAQSPATRTNTAQKTKDTRQQKKPAVQAKTTSAPLPVPTATNPVPKEGLVFGRLFDDL